MPIRPFATASVGTAWMFAASRVCAEYAVNLPPPHTEVARQIYDLNTLILWICLGIFFVVFGAMFYAILKHRKSVGHKAHHFHENTLIEVIWTIIPFFILAGMAWPATKTVIHMKDTSRPDMTVKITGYQWKWEYEYLQDGVKYFSTLATPREQIDNRMPKGEHYLLETESPLVVPTGKKIRLLLTANDVIHAWWVPALGVKQDAIPGFIRDAWIRIDKPGVYRGQCAELCGRDHAYMPVVVQAMEPAQYTAWLADQKTRMAAAAAEATRTLTFDELRARGEKLYSANCAACHQASGAGLPGTFPALDRSPVVNGAKEGHINIVLNGGRPGTAMPAFGKQLSDLDIAAVITYERNAWNNKTGDAIQAADVKALRK